MPRSPPARSSSSSQSASGDASAASEPGVISIAAPGGVPAASANATCIRPCASNAASRARS
eukprot:1341183-Pleurochrysis_carterae.AAC.1